jgi:methionine-S-sulfoxide reductase
MDSVPEGLPVIVLDHNPAAVNEYDRGDLILCGHTHKGQIFPGSLFTRRLFPVDYGYYRRDDSAPHVIVSSGAGTWGMPMRVGTDCEIVLIRLYASAQERCAPAASAQKGAQHMKTIYLAGGCFWGLQKFIDQFDGVIETEVGYANGPDRAPSYQEVCRNSGHAETVRVVYDESTIPLEKLLDFYFMVIDPLSVNKQGGDAGIQYRTGVYYTDESDLSVIRRVFAAQEKKAGAALAVVTEPLRNFFSAEEYHQKYLEKNPDGYCHIPRHYFDLNGKK